MSDTRPGRSCPLRYRYGAHAIRVAPERTARTLYVIGGLYGNLPALDAVEVMARTEAAAPTLCYNGDFNWFNVADDAFVETNRRVLAHEAIAGNVEAELVADATVDSAGCGCAYPDAVEDGIVERSNAIHRLLSLTSSRHPEVEVQLARLPMFARYRVADCRVGVVHGDSESLAGWRFDVGALDEPDAQKWLHEAFEEAEVDVFASTHTCLPVMRPLHGDDGVQRWVVNNGAAGMPNFRGDRRGLLARISTAPAARAEFGEVHVCGAYVSLQPIVYDAERWRDLFLRQWPPGSPAWESYYKRIADGPAYSTKRALGVAGSG